MFNRIRESAEAAYWDMHWCGADEADPVGFALLGELREAAQRRDIVRVVVCLIKLRLQ